MFQRKFNNRESLDRPLWLRIFYVSNALKTITLLRYPH